MPDQTKTRREFLGAASAAAAAGGLSPARGAAAGQRPNIVIVLTDDQGYGDLSCHGNAMIRTPNLDRLHTESVRFTDFHVDPLCAPTRAGLLTGRYAYRTGVTAAIGGRSTLRRDEVTMADIFRENGYRTGIFGKWHQGDNYPYRPAERGFDESVVCWSGGVTQAADFWGNDYFDDTYYRNNRPEKFTGYCTDVFFREALRFVEQNRDRPFFLYLPTNAPHAPFFVDERYSRPYLERGVPPTMAAFYGMIANIDENVGRLRSRMAELGIADNTIFIFMNDNGTAAGLARPNETGSWKGFNAGMRQAKGSQYDGGHRAAFFLSWPAGGIGKRRDVRRLAAHIDVLPTLMDLAGVPNRRSIRFDGISLKPLLSGQGRFPEDRTHFIQHQQFRVNGELQMENPKPFLHSAVLTERWRLVDGAELYDIKADPAQQRDVAGEHADVVARLRGAYMKWWDDVTSRFDEYLEIVVGSEHENPSRLTSFDWYGGAGPANQARIKEAPWTNGFWAIEVARAGRYEITLRQQPPEAEFPIEGVTARLKIGGREMERPIPRGAKAVPFALDLEAGKTTLQTWFISPDGRSRGAYYTYVKYLAEEGFQPLFNGRDLEGWEIDTASVWQVRDGVIIGKSPGLKYNEFLRTKRLYSDFVLKVTMRIIDGEGNSGVQFRSKAVPGSHEVSGYQADAGVRANGEPLWGVLYDESRRRVQLAKPPREILDKFDLKAWHEYVITARGNRIRLEVDGITTVDYEEKDPGIEREGFIALQVHSHPRPIEVHFKSLWIKEL